MDDFERELRDMLGDRVVSMPPPADASPQLLTRARRRRAAKMTALAVSVVIVAGGTAGAIAHVTRDDRPHQVITSTPTTIPRPIVQTVLCPPDPEPRYPTTVVVPPLLPRVPTAGDAEALSMLQSFASADRAQFVVLGPKRWACHVPQGPRFAMVVYNPAVTTESAATADNAPIVVEYASPFSDPRGAPLACTVFDDPSVMKSVGAATADCLNERTPQRTATRVNEHVSTFVDANGDRGVGFLRLPAPESGSAGSVIVLTCRPNDDLSAATCDTIIADFVARIDAEIPPTAPTAPSTSTTATTSTTTTTTTTPSASVATVVCPVTYALTDHTTAHPSAAPRTPSAGDPALFSHLESFAATDDPRMVALGPSGWTCHGLLAADGNNGMVVYKTADPGGAPPDIYTAPIAVDSDWLWHGGVGSVTACRATGDQAAVQYVTQLFPQDLPCPSAGRTVTKIDAHAWSFVDADGAHGAAWMVLPSSPNVDDGMIGVLTCRPTDGLTIADCDTIIADWLARNDTTG
jgi:hypothetical protein